MKSIKNTITELKEKVSEKREANKSKRAKVAKIIKTCAAVATTGLAITDTIVLAKNGFFGENVKPEDNIVNEIIDAAEQSGATVVEITEF